MAALQLSDSDRSLCDKLVGMLGSSFDGERLNALAILERMADSYKIPIRELLLGTNGSGGSGSNSDRQRAERAERETREADLQAARAEQAAREARRARPAEPDPHAATLPPDWRDLFAGLDHSSFLTDCEATFVSDLIAHGTRYPSPKQAALILQILEKAAAFSGPTASDDADADWGDME